MKRHPCRRIGALGISLMAVTMATMPGRHVGPGTAYAQPTTSEPDLAYLDALSASFGRAETSVKLDLIDILEGLGTPAVPVLADALGDTSSKVRRSVADALGDLGKPARPAIPRLLDTLGDESEDVRRNAVNAIGRIGDGIEAAERLLPILSDGSPTMRRETARALRRMRVFSPAIASALLASLSDDERNIRRESERALGRLGEPVIPILRDALKTASPQAGPAILRALSDVGLAAVPVVVDYLTHEDAEMRWEAADALGDMQARSPDVLAALLPLFDDPNERVRLEAIDTIGDTKATSTDLPQALGALLDDSSSEVRQRAVEALGEIEASPAAVAPHVVRALSDGDEDVREAAMKVLKQLGKNE